MTGMPASAGGSSGSGFGHRRLSRGSTACWLLLVTVTTGSDALTGPPASFLFRHGITRIAAPCLGRRPVGAVPHLEGSQPPAGSAASGQNRGS
jgi:hypothetical protein